MRPTAAGDENLVTGSRPLQPVAEVVAELMGADRVRRRLGG